MKAVTQLLQHATQEEARLHHSTVAREYKRIQVISHLVSISASSCLAFTCIQCPWLQYRKHVAQRFQMVAHCPTGTLSYCPNDILTHCPIYRHTGTLSYSPTVPLIHHPTVLQTYIPTYCPSGIPAHCPTDILTHCPTWSRAQTPPPKRGVWHLLTHSLVLTPSRSQIQDGQSDHRTTNQTCM